jgi:hypothetical protein
LESLRAVERTADALVFRLRRCYHPATGSRQGVAPRIARVCCSERLRAIWPARCSLCHDRLGLETTLRRNANRSLQDAMQLAAETEFCAWRLEVGTVARGRKPQSLQDFSCTPAGHVPDMSGTFMETQKSRHANQLRGGGRSRAKPVSEDWRSLVTGRKTGRFVENREFGAPGNAENAVITNSC